MQIFPGRNQERFSIFGNSNCSERTISCWRARVFRRTKCAIDVARKRVNRNRRFLRNFSGLRDRPNLLISLFTLVGDFVGGGIPHTSCRLTERVLQARAS